VEDNSNVIEIENEYNRINTRWLTLHYLTTCGLVLFAFLFECVLSIKLYNTTGADISIYEYIIKYILAPLAVNSVFIGIGYWVTHSLRFAKNTKMYMVSLFFVIISFVFYTVHSIFPSLYLIFSIPIVLTVVYGDYLLTTVTALFSLTGKIISDLFIRWAPNAASPISGDFGLTDFFISISILSVFFVVCLIVIRFEKEKKNASIQKEIERYQLQYKLQTDELTAINNRTALRKAIQNMENDHAGNTYTFVMIDLDNFKMVNDTLGHDIGDQCLKDFGSILKANCGDAAPFRFGGDEFCVLFINKTVDGIIKICERIQTDFKKIALELSIDFSLTASFGIARYLENMTTAQLLKNTDSALYRSKSVKNAIYIYDDYSGAFKSAI
jgi:diguanylate cyclase (GGDEF)-like protein